MTPKKENLVREIPLEEIMEPSLKDRLEINQEDVERLAESINKIGLMQPIEVTKKGEKYEVVFGHRRFLAHKLLKRKTITAMVRKIDEQTVRIRRATENLGRLNLSPVEEAAIYNDLHNEYGMSWDDISKHVGKSAARIMRHTQILSMPTKMQKALHTKKVSLGVCESLMGCGDAAHREYLLEMCIEHGVTVAVARMWVEDWKKSERLKKSDIAGGGSETHLMEDKPVYTSCDVCFSAVEYKDLKYMQICPECFKRIKGAVQQ